MMDLKEAQDLDRYATKHLIVVSDDLCYSVYMPDIKKESFLGSLLSKESKRYSFFQNYENGYNEKYDATIEVSPFLWNLFYRETILVNELKKYLRNEKIERLESTRKNLIKTTLYPRETLYDGYMSIEEKLAYIKEFLDLTEVPNTQKFALQSLKNLLYQDLLLASPLADKEMGDSLFNNSQKVKKLAPIKV